MLIHHDFQVRSYDFLPLLCAPAPCRYGTTNVKHGPSEPSCSQFASRTPTVVPWPKKDSGCQSGCSPGPYQERL